MSHYTIKPHPLLQVERLKCSLSGMTHGIWSMGTTHQHAH